MLEKRREILSLPPERALAAILDSPNALPLVHSFAEEDLYWLIHDIGAADAVPILALASNKQWEYMLDMEVWQVDRFAVFEALEWFELLLEADDNRLVQWLAHDQLDIFELSLFKNIRVVAREHDEDPSAFGPEYITIDGVYYFRFLEHSLAEKEDKESAEARRELLTRILKRMADSDYERYRSIMVEFSSLLPAEAEEEMYRLRNVRMAEKGFLPFEEAVGIYQPLPAGEAEKMVRQFAEPKRDFLLPVSIYSVEMLMGEDLFARVVACLEDPKTIARVQTEFASLCNRIIAADRKRIRERSELSKVVKKAGGYIGIGLQRLAQDVGAHSVGEYANWVERLPLAEIFRTGYDLAMKLKIQTDKWHRQSWFTKAGLTLHFWGENWMGLLGGLMLKRPLFYDNYARGTLYREFDSLADVESAQAGLNAICSMDRLLAAIDPRIPDLQEHFLTYKNLILTLWARDFLAMPEKGEPIGLEEFRPFFEALFSREQEAPGGTAGVPHGVNKSMKENFLGWLSRRTGVSERNILIELDVILEALFQEIESEYGSVDSKHLDPRHIHLIMLKQQRR